MDVFQCEYDWQLGKILKYYKPNPTGEDVYLAADGVTVTRDEDKIIKAQRIFKHHHYKPEGAGARAALKRLREGDLGVKAPVTSVQDDSLSDATGGQ